MRESRKPAGAGLLLVVALVAGAVALPNPAGAQVSAIGLASKLAGSGSLLWPDGTWYMKARLFDAGGSPIGSETSEISFSLSAQWPSIQVTMSSTAASDSLVRFYRKLGSSIASVDEIDVQAYDFVCGSNAVCDVATPSNIALQNGLKWNPLFADDFETMSTARWSATVP